MAGHIRGRRGQTTGCVFKSYGHVGSNLNALNDIYIRTYIHTYIYIHIHTYTYIYIHIHTYIYNGWWLVRFRERRRGWNGKQRGENQFYRTASIIPPTHNRQLYHRHTTKMNDSKIQAQAASDSLIDSSL
jgi:hypothetical protein